MVLTGSAPATLMEEFSEMLNSVTFNKTTKTGVNMPVCCRDRKRRGRHKETDVDFMTLISIDVKGELEK